jgi:4'-phosphopantetheinyl transferase EntD
VEVKMPVLQTYTLPIRGIWKIAETFSELTGLFNSKDEEFLAYICNTGSEARKKEYLAVRLLLRHLLGKDVQICYNTDGSPFLADGKYFISISHTKGYAAIILSKAPFPGIDIEYRSSRTLILKERFLSAEESNLIKTDQSISSADFATLFWCAKEAAFKSIRCENVDFIKHLHILSCSTEKNSGTLIINETKTENMQTFAMDFEMTDDYILIWKG